MGLQVVSPWHGTIISLPELGLLSKTVLGGHLDLVETLRSKITKLENGDHSSGLQATLGHIEAAIRHFERGQKELDETLYTDVIYRTNQAFEGGIKEAFRVLIGKDPKRKKMYDIEKYLEANSVLTDRVLSQFRIYRQEWRNPSTHDYKLEFVESEAFLAIISVSAFACVLSDQIAGHMAYTAVKEKAVAAASQTVDTFSNNFDQKTLFGKVAFIIEQFVSTDLMLSSGERPSESELIGALQGAVSEFLPSITVRTEVVLESGEQRFFADMVVSDGEERVLVELKRFSGSNLRLSAGIEQVEKYLAVSGIQKAVLAYVPAQPEQAEVTLRSTAHFDYQMGVIFPVSVLRASD